jgi:hypothetical protein
MSNEKQLEVLQQLIAELEHEMWYNVHTDSPHKAAKVKGWVDQLKEQANAVQVQVTNISNQTTNA